MMLLYRTIAPKKFTVKPIKSKNENEKKIQNHINVADLTPFVLQNRNNKKRNSRIAVSVAAAIDKICFTSPGCGRRVVELKACGALIKKLPIVGFNSGKSKPEFPCRVLKAFCLSTTACGKSNRGEIKRSEKNNNPLNRYVEIKISAILFLSL